MNRQLIQLLYVSLEEGKQWPSFKDWLYAITFILVFFVLMPWIGSGAGL